MFVITAFYHFSAISGEELALLQEKLLNEGEKLQLCGLILLATEGINGTIAGSAEGIQGWKDLLHNTPYFKGIQFKDSSGSSKPFKRFRVDIRTELITFGQELPLPSRNGSHLSPQEWQKVLEEDPEILLLDVRNRYETAIGKFQGALDPEIDVFTQFPEYLDRAAIPKEKKVLMYCTGGIRCEKAALAMNQRGYKNVFQLDGGILNYLEKLPNRSFEGECFVFDHRVSVDQKLAPSTRYTLCPHCGNAADQHITCGNCEKKAVVCRGCLDTPSRHSCSKNCEYHLGCNCSAKNTTARVE